MNNDSIGKFIQRQTDILNQRNAAKETRKSKKLSHAYDRIEGLVDNDSFVEIGANVLHQQHEFGMQKKKVYGDGVLTGLAQIESRPVYVFSHDASFYGGSLGEAFAKKIVKIMDQAIQNGYPLIGLNESSGARIQEGVSSLAGYADIFYRNVKASGVIPQISIILGPCAGGAVYSPAITDFVIMVDKTSHMFITGPDVIRAVTGEEVTFEELGGAMMHNQESGVAQLIASDEEEAFLMCRKLLSFLPSNNLETPVKLDFNDDIDVQDFENLNSIIPDDSNKSYDMNDVIHSIVDDSDFFEISPYFAKNIIVGFGRIGGHSVGVVANQPKVLAGVLDINASIKAARFIRFCDAFNIPIITFVDVPGYLPGVNQEKNGIIRNGAKLLYAYCEATVPKITIITRKAYGGAFDVMGSKNVGADFNIAWPYAEIAVMGASGAANILYRNQLKNSSNPEQTRQELIKQYQDKFSNPYIASELGFIDTIVMPSQTKKLLVNLLNVKSTKRQNTPPRKHGNIPL